MNDIFAMIGKVLGLCFAATVILYTSLLTWQLAGRIIPGNPIAQAMTLVLFDVAALVWFVQFLTQAKGTLQWAFAGLGFLVGLAGAIIMAAGELVLGQQLVKLDDPTKIGWILIVTVVVAALAHAALTYAFHFADPGVKGRIENAQEVSKAVERAYSDARSEIARNVDHLVAGLRDSVLYEAERQIAASTAVHIRNGHKLEEKVSETLQGDNVIDAQATDLPARPAPRKAGIRWPWVWWNKNQVQTGQEIKPEAEPKQEQPTDTQDTPGASHPPVDPTLVMAVLAALAQIQAVQPAPSPNTNGHKKERIFEADTQSFPEVTDDGKPNF